MGRRLLGNLRAGSFEFEQVIYTNTMEQGISRNDYACYGRIVVAGPGVDVASPVVEVDVFH